MYINPPPLQPPLNPHTHPLTSLSTPPPPPQLYNILGCPGAQFSRLGDLVPFPSLLLALLVLPLRAAAAALLLPFLALFLLLLLTASLLWLPIAATAALFLPTPNPPRPLWQFLFPLAHRLHLRRARLASDLVLGGLVTALLLLLTCLEAFWLPMGVLVCLVSLAVGVGSCRDALSALFLPVYALNAVMSGRA